MEEFRLALTHQDCADIQRQNLAPPHTHTQTWEEWAMLSQAKNQQGWTEPEGFGNT